MSDLSAQLQNLTDLVERLTTSAEGAQAEGLDPKGAAAFLSVSIEQLRQWNDKGIIPAPVTLSERCPRWSRTELKLWLVHGAPTRLQWSKMREMKLRAAG